MKTETLYHGTLTKNISSIQKKGIRARKKTYYDKLIEKYGKTSKSAIEQAMNRIGVTANKVYVSGSWDYALQNCRAGLEAEIDLMALKMKKNRRTAWKKLVKDNPCSIVTIKIPCNIKPLHKNIWVDDKYREGYISDAIPICEQIDKAYTNLKKKRNYLTRDDVKRDVFTQLIFKEIKPEWIKNIKNV